MYEWSADVEAIDLCADRVEVFAFSRQVQRPKTFLTVE